VPFINIRISKTITREQELTLKNGLGKAIELVPGKSEKYLLLTFQDNVHIYLRGDDSQPVAFIEANIFGNENHAGYEEFSAAVCKLFAETLEITPDHIYINFSDIPDWSVAGMNIDRNRYA